MGRSRVFYSCCINLGVFIISAGAAVLVWWLIFKPHDMKAYVDGATLNQFNLAVGSNNSSSLSYNLTFDLAVRNPNRRIGIYYDLVEATAVYGSAPLESTELPAFYQHTKNTTRLHPAFEGQATGAGSSAAAVAAFEREVGEGFFNLDVKLHMKVRFKVWFIRIGHFKRDFDCMAKFPVPANGSSSSVTSPGTECDS